LLTGSTGFIGGALVSHFLDVGVKFNTLSKSASNNAKKDVKHHQLDLNDYLDWEDVFENVQTVVHTAGKAHTKINSVSKNEFIKTNLTSTIEFARQAAASGVQRFVYLSTLNINGISSKHSISEIDPVSPSDLSAKLKFEVEAALIDISSETGMEIVIVRCPLVYGPRVKANFLRFLKLSNTNMPLPFGVVKKKRSMIYVGNLIDFIIKCIDHPVAANQIFFISDNNDLPLNSLITLIRTSMNRPIRLIPVPVFIFKLAGFLFRKQDLVEKLVGGIQVNSSKAMTSLHWKPPYTVEQGIQTTVDSFLKENK
jgi:nucleoside-diphosphate-sugar epimerase